MGPVAAVQSTDLLGQVHVTMFGGCFTSKFVWPVGHLHSNS